MKKVMMLIYHQSYDYQYYYNFGPLKVLKFIYFLLYIHSIPSEMSKILVLLLGLIQITKKNDFTNLLL